MAQSNLTADKIITEKQARAILKEVGREKDAAMATGGNFKYVTDYYLFSLAHLSGLRVSELAGLKWGDLYEESLIVRHGKGVSHVL